MRRLSILSLVLSLFLALPALAADPVRVDITAVDEQPGKMDVTFTATGPDGKPINGLTSQSFAISINDKAIAVSNVESIVGAHVPLSVLLLVDVSGSMAGDRITQARAAMQDFVNNLDPADQVGVMSFSSSVTLVQDFTSDRAALNRAIGGLTPVGETALFDAMIAGTGKIAGAANPRRLIVLLTDGEATLGLDKRAASVTAVRNTGVGVVSVALGTQLDRAYLNEITTASNGRLLEATTPAALRQAYGDLATSIRSQYTLTIAVPQTIDRTQPGKISLRVTAAAGSGTTERSLAALPGALPPPFSLSLNGLTANKKIKAATAIQPVAQPGITYTRVEYLVDGQPAGSSEAAPFAFQLDPSVLSGGNHVLTVIATDSSGRQGQVQLPFSSVAPSADGGGSSPGIPPFLLVIVPLGALSMGLFYFVRKRLAASKEDAGYTRVKPWAVRNVESEGPVEGWPEPLQPQAAPAPVAPADPVLGRVIVMNENLTRESGIEGIQEYEIHTTPLIFGSGSHVDIRVDDDDFGRIAAEEARLWVQKSRLVYHKLTTLSAMATEGVTSGWEFLEDGEDIRIGPYRIFFHAEGPEEATAPSEPEVHRPAQEHGMTLRDLWSQVENDPSLRPQSE